MPYCSYCGIFEIYLKPLNLCNDCFNLYRNNSLSPSDILRKKKQISKTQINLSLLYYISDVIPPSTMPPRYPSLSSNEWRMVPPQNPQSTRRDNNPQHSELNESRGSLNQGEIFSEDEDEQDYYSIRVPRNNRPPQRPRATFQTHLKSNIALIILIIVFFVSTPIISIPLEITAIILGLLAMRDEPRNWRHIFIIVVATILIFIEIIGLIFYDEILALAREMGQAE